MHRTHPHDQSYPAISVNATKIEKSSSRVIHVWISRDYLIMSHFFINGKPPCQFDSLWCYDIEFPITCFFFSLQTVPAHILPSILLQSPPLSTHDDSCNERRPHLYQRPHFSQIPTVCLSSPFEKLVSPAGCLLVVSPLLGEKPALARSWDRCPALFWSRLKAHRIGVSGEN